MPVDKFTDLETYYPDVSEEDDILDYIWSLALLLLPVVEEYSEYTVCGSLAISKFKRRYNDGLIDMPLTYDAYKANNDIQTTIIGLGIDPDKFWYALLFIKDYTDGECLHEFGRGDAPITELNKFSETISNYEITECNPLIEKVHFSKEIKLSIIVDGKTEITIESPNTIKHIQSLCCNSLAQLNTMKEKEIDAMTIIPRYRITASPKKSIPIFTNTFKLLFDELNLNKGKRGNSKVSYNKSFLISQLIFLTGISKEENYYVDKVYLKDRLSKVKKVVATGAVNKIYE
nr:hypothetical protein [uncultured Bacteroides sp.]